MSYKILSLDGGGIRSLFQAIIIKRLVEETNFLRKTQYFAGTSGGAIVAAGLAYGVSVDEIISLFRDKGEYIFYRNFRDKLEDLFSITGAKYDSNRLKKVLQEIFGNAKLGDLKKKLLVTSFDLNNKEKGYWRPVVFHNFNGPKNSKDMLLVDAVLSSISAPTYFKIYGQYIDGGVWANNPIMAGVSEAIRPYSGRKKVEDLRALSLGTLFNAKRIKSAKKDFGIVDWLKNGLLDIFLDGASSGAAHYYAESLLGVHYKRFNPVIKKVINLDDVDKIDKIIRYGETQDIDDLVSWLRGFWL